ncbi:MAG: hypothetical protein E7441_06750 [Ruminococcaceae bacterium]|nr:hypothetical protein [Oscillospiraceae bacterium]
MEFVLNENAICIDTVINSESTVRTIKNATAKDYASVVCALAENGYEPKGETDTAFHKFRAYLKNGTGVFVNYFTGIDEITVCTEEKSNYFSYSDIKGTPKVSSQITQVQLHDFGMSYVIRLSDGRFIIIDGGWDHTGDTVRLYEALLAGSENGKPVIAAWIFTHMDCDHYRCINVFTELYREDVTVQKFMFNFPAKKKNNFEREEPHILKAFENMKLYGAEIYYPHTGQIYKIGNALLEFLSCTDDTYYFTEDDNAASLVFRMELEGQIILWTGDACFSDSALLKKYGAYLKSDILQVPHHGFLSGETEEQKRCYDLIAPEVCFLPVSDYHAYVLFDTYISASEYLMREVPIKQLITGDETTVITLPYRAPEGADKKFKEKFSEGRKAAGGRVWIYSGLRVSDKEDFVFEVLNTAWSPVKVSVELFFDDAKALITEKDFDIPQFSVKKVNILEVAGEIKAPPTSPCAIRFMCETGIVVTHERLTASYKI